MSDKFILKDREFSSRLIVGTGKYPSKEVMVRAIEDSNAEMVTIALRRVDFNNPSDNLASFIDSKKYTILPNTSGAKSADEAIRIALIAREALNSNWIKIEVTPESKYLLPDGEETLKATKALVKEGFYVMPYINADPILAKKLEDEGAATVMPLGSPIGTNRGLQTREFIRIIVREAKVPVIVDAGIGRPSDAALAMELGADAVMINTAIAVANNPLLMAKAFRDAVIAGRNGYLAGIAAERDIASPSSSLDWVSKL